MIDIVKTLFTFCSGAVFGLMLPLLLWLCIGDDDMNELGPIILAVMGAILVATGSVMLWEWIK